jgi:hypothetical protein
MILTEGEVREVGIEVINQAGDDFEISTANYVIYTRDETSVTSGTATIDDHKILTLFSANTQGQFFVEFTYQIASETLKAKVFVEVN